MPVTVKTFATSGEAAAALSSERDARYLGGGTLVMRALNEGDLSVSTVVRATDRALTQIEFASSRITIGAGVTFARVLAERELAFLHPVAASIGGPAVRNMGTVGGNLFAPTPFGDFAVALLALDATVAVQGGYGARDVPIEEFLAGRDRQQTALVLSQDRAHQAERRLAGNARSTCSDQWRPRHWRAHRLRRDGGDAGSRQGGRTRDRRARARYRKHRCRGRRGDRRHFARQ
jgi:CO/xanthine dehydrogenase FAD-binding subunit